MSLSSARRRQAFLAVHQWLGLASGLIVAVLCLTGTLLALQGPIEGWINRDVQRVVPKGAPMALEVLVPRLAADAEAPFTGLVVPQAPDEALQLRQGRVVTYVDPYTGEVLGGVNPGVREAFMTVFRLHRWLLLDDAVGRPVTGAATAMFAVILLSGLVLWWPRRVKQVLQAVRIRRHAAWRGLNLDLHVVLGFWAFLPLLVMALSAFNWSYNAPFKAAVYGLLDGGPAPERRRPPAGEGPTVTTLPYRRILAETERAYPYAGPVRLSFPRAASEPVEVTKVHTPTAASVPYVDGLTLDARTGAVLARAPFAEKTRAAQVMALIKDLHVGTVFGGWSLGVYLLAAAVGTTLPVTGALHWWGKLAARRRARGRLAEPEAPQPIKSGSSM